MENIKKRERNTDESTESNPRDSIPRNKRLEYTEDKKKRERNFPTLARANLPPTTTSPINDEEIEGERQVIP